MNDDLEAIDGLCTEILEQRDRIEALEAALLLAEDVLSRFPFSTAMWPNGMHPQIGIDIIRTALNKKRAAHETPRRTNVT
jgi:hypothetical protein